MVVPEKRGSGMMEKWFVGEALCRAAWVRYYLLEEETAESVSYGVEIELGGEAEAVRNLSPSRRRVRELAEELARGTVTPVALRDVVDDWLLE